MTKKELLRRLGNLDEKLEDLQEQIEMLEDERGALIKKIQGYDEEAEDRLYDEFEERRRARI